MATISKWNPFGVSLNITATGSSVKRTSATEFTVSIYAHWVTYEKNNQTDYGMKVTTGNQTDYVISTDGVKRHSDSKTFTAKYSISGNGSQTKTISVVFKNYNDYHKDSATKTVTFNVTVPEWTYYTVSYNANGGSGAPSSQKKYKDQKLTLSSTRPTRTGHTFLGWSTSSSATAATYTAGGSYTSNSNTTLYAVWKPDTYTVTFNANGGTGAPGSQTKTYGVTLKLSSVVPTRANYTFLGWSTSSSATSATYSAGGNYTTNAKTTLYAVWKLAYVNPTILTPVVSRYMRVGETENYEASDSGNYARVYFVWSTFQDVKRISIKWSASGIAEKEKLLTPGGKVGIVVQYLGDGEINPDSTYTFVITVTDASGSTTVRKTLPGTKYAIDLLAGGNGVAFGKPAELSGVADIGFETKMRKPLYVDNNTAFNGYDPDGTLVEFINPVNGSGNTVLGYGNYDRRKGNTNIYGYDVNFGVSNISSPGTYRPYRRRGDSINFTLRTAGYVTNAGKDVTFTVPFAVPIVGSPTVTVSSLNGFILRQGANYTHGSTASVYVVPDSYEAIVSQWMGVTITAKFSDTTNVTNNDAIGIYWNGTITFS